MAAGAHGNPVANSSAASYAWQVRIEQASRTTLFPRTLYNGPIPRSKLSLRQRQQLPCLSALLALSPLSGFAGTGVLPGMRTPVLGSCCDRPPGELRQHGGVHVGCAAKAHHEVCCQSFALSQLALLSSSVASGSAFDWSYRSLRHLTAVKPELLVLSFSTAAQLSVSLPAMLQQEASSLSKNARLSLLFRAGLSAGRDLV